MTPEELAANTALLRAEFRRCIAALKALEADFKRFRPHAAKLLRCAADLRERYAALDRFVARGDEPAIKLHRDRVRLGQQQLLDELQAFPDTVEREGREKIEAMIAAFRAKFPSLLPPPQSTPPFARKRQPFGGKKD
jgi:hypothetical protein